MKVRSFNRKEYQKKYYIDNKERLIGETRAYAAANHSWLLRGAKRRAIKAGLPFNINMTDIVVPECCPILGVKLEKGTRYAPSLDRKDPRGGYTKDNVWVVSKIANQMKSDSTLEEQRKFAEWVKTLRQSQKTSTNC